MVNPEKKEAGPVRRSSAAKRQLQSERRRVANKSVRSCIKTKVRALRATHHAGDALLPAEMNTLYSLADKAAKKGIISKNKASRIKSGVAKKRVAAQ